MKNPQKFISLFFFYLTTYNAKFWIYWARFWGWIAEEYKKMHEKNFGVEK